MWAGCTFLAESKFRLTLEEKVPNNLEPRDHPCMCFHQLHLSGSSSPSFSHIVLKKWGRDFPVSCKTKFQINFLQQGASFQWGSSDPAVKGSQYLPTNTMSFCTKKEKKKKLHWYKCWSSGQHFKLPQSVKCINPPLKIKYLPGAICNAFPIKKKKSQFSYLKIGCIHDEVFLQYGRLNLRTSPDIPLHSITNAWGQFITEMLDHSFTKDNIIILMSQELIGKTPHCRLAQILISQHLILYCITHKILEFSSISEQC